MGRKREGAICYTSTSATAVPRLRRLRAAVRQACSCSREFKSSHVGDFELNTQPASLSALTKTKRSRCHGVFESRQRWSIGRAVQKAASHAGIDESSVVRGPSNFEACIMPAANVRGGETDEGKPTCNRCAQLGHACEGYAGINFIDERPVAERKVERQARRSGHLSIIRESNTTSQSALSSRSSPNASLRPSVLAHRAKTDSPPRSSAFGADSAYLSDGFQAPHAVSLSGFQHEIFSAFAAKHLPSALDQLGTAATSTSHSERLYSPILVAYQNARGVSGLCFDALASSFFGRAHNHPETARLGQRKYLMALRRLQDALYTVTARPDQDLLAAISILLVYEVC